jgi:hypothetical protein
MPELTPIVLFVYNRPDHTRKTLESLADCFQASDSHLFIFCDGPKPDASRIEIEKIKEVRRVIGERKWCAHVKITESETNRGLANSIIHGVTKITYEYGKVIVLEDDLVVSPFFLQYMNDALHTYEKTEKVMQVCGYMFPIDSTGLKDSFLLRLTSSWGWGTWKRAWKFFESNANILLSRFPDDAVHRFNLDGAYDYFSFFRLLREKRVDSWAIRWYASVFLQDGLCVHPSRSLILNAGNDDSGIHSGNTSMYDTTLMDHKVTYFEESIEENPEARLRVKRYFLHGHRTDAVKSRLHSYLRNMKNKVMRREL